MSDGFSRGYSKTAVSQSSVDILPFREQHYKQEREAPMEAQQLGNTYYIWGVDDSPYGPVELPILIDWIKDERVLPETWVYSRTAGNWMRASELPELKPE